MWEGESPLGNEVRVLSGLRRALLRAEGGLVATISPSPEARHSQYFPALLWGQISTRSLLRPLGDTPPPLWDNHSGSGCPRWVVLQEGRTHGAPISLERSTPRNWGKKDRFPIGKDSLANAGKL